MTVKDTIAGLQAHTVLTGLHPLGFVPTMGALHKGHLALVARAVNECPAVTVSIFVNPTQFNDPGDLERYPRTPERDLELLAGILRKNDVVFLPATKEIYPEKDSRVFDFGGLDKVMEGAFRPGHFNGVAQVVSKLFDIVSPGIAYFGRKDFQQAAIIKDLVRQTGSPVKIVVCPTIREDDGLAMSSRNALLEPRHREKAGLIYRYLNEAALLIRETDVEPARDFFKKNIEAVEGFSLQYFEVVDDITLRPLTGKKQAEGGMLYTICVALYAGKIRLIDNIPVSLL